MAIICVDSGFFIGLHDPRDGHSAISHELFNSYFKTTRNRLLVPWPIWYESLGTRMARRPDRVSLLKAMCEAMEKQGRLVKIDDSPYRELALLECFDEDAKLPGSYRHLSLADRVIRHFLGDHKHRIDYFVTFNSGDFKDVCQKRGIRMLPEGRPS